ncbi:PadR family transcriptional regulator [Lentzea cavernae]|uniref:Transcription regulator PadR N-terminal domain-containing protein n=1 Tax=Lentzea cavernae TaxID=2020703 RepID=A0ABQ3M324_9PSEU|nr:helix-turn-helix transcriptional regulator [Lentzea cavernae]GHH32507.1 hypothetical protein GCM10017774_13520 [Lentzea cavernae]
MTMPTQAVLRALLDDPSAERYGLELCAAAQLPSGTVHPILARLESIGWVESRWETVQPEAAGRPRRRYYRLNADGVAHARAALARSEAKATKLATRLRLGFAGGEA